jgi:hypothetical protein
MGVRGEEIIYKAILRFRVGVRGEEIMYKELL